MESNLKKYERHEEFIESLTAEIAGREIRKGMTDIAKKCVLIGFYLKAVRDRELYQEAGYSSLWDYAMDQFGLSMSSTSRYMALVFNKRRKGKLGYRTVRYRSKQAS